MPTRRGLQPPGVDETEDASEDSSRLGGILYLKHRIAHVAQEPRGSLEHAFAQEMCGTTA